MTTNKKIYICTLIIIIVIAFSYPTSAKIYISPYSYTGSLDADSVQDQVERWVRVQQSGKMLIALETPATSESNLQAKLDVLDENNRSLVIDREESDQLQLIYAQVPQFYGDDLDLKVIVQAVSGSGDYELRVIKPEELQVDSSLTGQIIYDLHLPSDKEVDLNEYLISWQGGLFEKEQVVPLVQALILDQATHELLADPILTQGEVPDLSTLPPGDYQLILIRQGAMIGRWQIYRKDSQYFQRRVGLLTNIISPGRNNRYVINLTGQEEHLWVFSDSRGSSIDTADNPILDITIQNGAGQELISDLARQNHFARYPLQGLSGQWQVKVSSQSRLGYGILIETDTNASQVGLLSHTVDQELQAGEKIWLLRNSDQEQTLTFTNPGDSQLQIQIDLVSSQVTLDLDSGRSIDYSLPSLLPSGQDFEVQSNQPVSIEYEVVERSLIPIDPAEIDDTPVLLNNQTRLLANLASATDQDFYQINIGGFSLVDFSLLALNTQQPLHLNLYDANGNLITSGTEELRLTRITGYLLQGSYLLSVDGEIDFSGESYLLEVLTEPYSYKGTIEMGR